MCEPRSQNKRPRRQTPQPISPHILLKTRICWQSRSPTGRLLVHRILFPALNCRGNQFYRCLAPLARGPLARIGHGFRLAIRPENWRWVTVVGAAPVVLGCSYSSSCRKLPQWAATRVARPRLAKQSPFVATFRPPIPRLTLLGICLGAVPTMGNWGSANWTVPWAGKVGTSDAPDLKA